MVTRRDYTAEGIEAARSVLIELVHLLGEYKDDIVLIGGWVPEVLLPHYSGPHVGSMDVDIALNHQKIQEEGYKRIEDLLRHRGYRQGEEAPFVEALVTSACVEVASWRPRPLPEAHRSLLAPYMEGRSPSCEGSPALSSSF